MLENAVWCKKRFYVYIEQYHLVSVKFNLQKVFPSYIILVVRGKWLGKNARNAWLWGAETLFKTVISSIWYWIFNGMKIYLHVVSQQS